MNYQDEIKECRELEKLFSLWKYKEPREIPYTNKETLQINHQTDAFISDGPINKRKWDSNTDKKILFVLKEAYNEEKDWNLGKWISGLDKYPAIWKRVAEWTYGICKSTLESVPTYNPNMKFIDMKDYLDKISVLNLKKSNGKSSSDYEEIYQYAMFDKEEIKKEIEILSPDIIICGYTFSALNDIYDEDIRRNKVRNDNWFYFTDKVCNKEVIVIDYYHPANHYPALINYYAVTNIYQQALKARR